MLPALLRAALVVGFSVSACQALAQQPIPPNMPTYQAGTYQTTPLPLPSPIMIPSPIPAPIPPPPEQRSIAPILPPSEETADINLNALYQEIVNLYGAGKYDEAMPLANRYVGLIEQSVGNDHLSYASAISMQARLYQAQGRFAKAEERLKRALAILERDRGPEHSDVASDLDALAQLDEDQGHLDEAEPLFKRALAIYEKAVDLEPANLGRSLNNLAWLYQKQGRYAEAEPLVTRALSVIEKALGPKHPDYGRALDTLAKLHEDQGRINEAEPLYRQALVVLESALGPEHESVAATRENLGGLLKSQGQFEEAEPLLKQALATKEKVFGADHPNVANALAQLGDLYRLQGKADAAKDLFERALAIRKAAIREVPVFFATDRKPKIGAKAVAFGGERSDTLTFGEATVMVPKPQAVSGRARFGASLSESTPVTQTNELAHMAIRNTAVKTEHEVMQAAEKRLSKAKQVFVFVHGFNVSFENALFRTAQIAYDLDFDGATFLFSWPSRERVLGYFSDNDTVQIAADHLRDFLQKIVSETKVAKIHFVAHSMGNEVLLRALKTIAEEDPNLRPVIGEIIDAAPDVDPDLFAHMVKTIKDKGGKITLYASHGDWALWFSGLFRGLPRAGFIDDKPLIITGVETVDITNAGTSYFALNHDVYASNPILVADMQRIIEKGEHPPDKRTKEFEPVVSKDGTYWRFRRPESRAAGLETGAIRVLPPQTVTETPPLPPQVGSKAPVAPISDRSSSAADEPHSVDSELAPHMPMPPAATPALSAASIATAPKAAFKKKRARRDIDPDWNTKLLQ